MSGAPYKIEGAARKGPRPPLMVTLMVRFTRAQYDALKNGGKPMSTFVRELVERELEAKR